MDAWHFLDGFMFEDINVTPKVDGIIILANSLCFVKPVTKTLIKFPVFIQRIEKSEMKCCNLLRNARGIWEIRIAHLNNFSLSCLFWSHSDFVPYDRLAYLFTSAFNKAIDSLKDSDTWNWSTQQLENRSSQIRSTLRFVYPNDYENFSHALRNNLDEMLGGWLEENGLSFCFRGMQMGQSALAKPCLVALVPNRNVEVLEAIIHFAFDFATEAGTLFWRRSSVVDRMSRPPNYEYCPMALCELGNYYFYTGNDNETNRVPGEASVGLLKLYSAVNKYVHHDSPFAKAELAVELLKSKIPSKKTNEKLIKFYKQVELLRRLMTTSEPRSSAYARLEAVVSTTEPQFNWQKQAYSKAFEHLRSCHFFEKNCLLTVPNEQVQYRLSTYLLPAANTFKLHLDRYSECILRDRFFDFSIQDYLNVSAAEALVCFLLYGIAVSTKDKKCHDNKMCKELGLIVPKFNKLGPEPELNPSLRSSALQISDYIHYNTSLSYDYVLHLIGTPMPNFGKCISEVSDAKFSTSAQELIHFIIVSTLKEQKSKAKESFKATHKTFGDRTNEVVLTTSDFVTWLMEGVEGTSRQLIGNHSGLLWVVNRFKELTKSKGFYDIWCQKVASTLEEALLKEPTFLNFVTPSKSLIVVPLSGTNGTNLSLFSPMKFDKYANMLFRIYKTLQEKRKGKSKQLDPFQYMRIKLGLGKVLEHVKLLKVDKRATLKINDIFDAACMFLMDIAPQIRF